MSKLLRYLNSSACDGNMPILLQRKESATESSASAAPPKKIKLSVKLSVPPAGQDSSQPPAQSSRAAADRPRAVEASEAELGPQHSLAAQPRAGASRPEGSQKPHKAAASRARLSEPGRAAPNRPGHRGLAKVSSASFLHKGFFCSESAVAC